MKQAIYVFQGPDRTKIGISNSPSRRLRQLRGRAHGLEFFYAASTNGFSAPELEHRALAILSEKKIAGEWFSVDGKTAVAAVLQAAAELGFSLRERGEIDSEDHLEDVDSESMTLRLPRVLLNAIDEYRATKRPSIPSRQDVIRLALTEWATRKGFLK